MPFVEPLFLARKLMSPDTTDEQRQKILEISDKQRPVFPEDQEIQNVLEAVKSDRFSNDEHLEPFLKYGLQITGGYDAAKPLEEQLKPYADLYDTPDISTGGKTLMTGAAAMTGMPATQLAAAVVPYLPIAKNSRKEMLLSAKEQMVRLLEESQKDGPPEMPVSEIIAQENKKRDSENTIMGGALVDAARLQRTKGWQAPVNDLNKSEVGGIVNAQRKREYWQNVKQVRRDLSVNMSEQAERGAYLIAASKNPEAWGKQVLPQLLDSFEKRHPELSGDRLEQARAAEGAKVLQMVRVMRPEVDASVIERIADSVASPWIQTGRSAAEWIKSQGLSLAAVRDRNIEFHDRLKVEFGADYEKTVWDEQGEVRPEVAKKFDALVTDAARIGGYRYGGQAQDAAMLAGGGLTDTEQQIKADWMGTARARALEGKRQREADRIEYMVENSLFREKFKQHGGAAEFFYGTTEGISYMMQFQAVGAIPVVGGPASLFLMYSSMQSDAERKGIYEWGLDPKTAQMICTPVALFQAAVERQQMMELKGTFGYQQYIGPQDNRMFLHAMGQFIKRSAGITGSETAEELMQNAADYAYAVTAKYGAQARGIDLSEEWEQMAAENWETVKQMPLILAGSGLVMRGAVKLSGTGKMAAPEFQMAREDMMMGPERWKAQQAVRRIRNTVRGQEDAVDAIPVDDLREYMRLKAAEKPEGENRQSAIGDQQSLEAWMESKGYNPLEDKPLFEMKEALVNNVAAAVSDRIAGFEETIAGVEDDDTPGGTDLRFYEAQRQAKILGLTVKTFDTQKEASAAYPAIKEQTDKGTDVRGMLLGRELVLVRENIADADAAVKTLKEEVGHRVVAVSPNKGSLLGQVRAIMGDEAIKAMLPEYADIYGKDMDAFSDEFVARKILAKLDTAKGRKMLEEKGFLGKMRSAVLDVFGLDVKSDELAAREVIRLAMDALEQVQTDKGLQLKSAVQVKVAGKTYQRSAAGEWTLKGSVIRDPEQVAMLNAQASEQAGKEEAKASKVRKQQAEKQIQALADGNPIIKMVMDNGGVLMPARDPGQPYPDEYAAIPARFRGKQGKGLSLDDLADQAAAFKGTTAYYSTSEFRAELEAFEAKAERILEQAQSGKGTESQSRQEAELIRQVEAGEITPEEFDRSMAELTGARFSVEGLSEEQQIEFLKNNWITIPEIKSQLKFTTCKTCGKTMYFRRPTGVNYKIHNPWHYSGKFCSKDNPQGSVSPGGSTDAEKISKMLEAAVKSGNVIVVNREKKASLVKVSDFIKEKAINGAFLSSESSPAGRDQNLNRGSSSVVDGGQNETTPGGEGQARFALADDPQMLAMKDVVWTLLHSPLPADKGKRTRRLRGQVRSAYNDISRQVPPNNKEIDAIIEEAQGIAAKAMYERENGLVDARKLAKFVSSEVGQSWVRRMAADTRRDAEIGGQLWEKEKQKVIRHFEAQGEQIIRKLRGYAMTELKDAHGLTFKELFEKMNFPPVDAPQPKNMDSDPVDLHPEITVGDGTRAQSDKEQAEPDAEADAGGDENAPLPELKDELLRYGVEIREVMGNIHKAVTNNLINEGVLRKDIPLWKAMQSEFAEQAYRKTMETMLMEDVQTLTHSFGRDWISNAVLRLGDYSTLNGFNNQVERILVNVNKYRVHETHEELTKRLEEITKAGSQEYRKSRLAELARKFPAVLERIMQRIRDAMFLSEDEVVKQLEAIADAERSAQAGSDQDAVDLRNEWKWVLEQYGAFFFKELSDKKTAIEYLEKKMADGLIAQEARREALKKQVQEDRDLIKATLKPGKLKGWGAKKFSDIWTGFIFLSQKLEELVSGGTGADFERATAWAEKFGRDMGFAGYRKAGDDYRAQQDLLDALRVIYGTKDAADVVRDLTQKRPELSKFSLANQPLSRDEVLQMLAHLGNRRYRNAALVMQEMEQKIKAMSGESAQFALKNKAHEEIMAALLTHPESYRAYRSEATGVELTKQQVLAALKSIADGARLTRRLEMENKMLAVLQAGDWQLVEWFREYYRKNRKRLSSAAEEITGLMFEENDPHFMPVSVEFSRVPVQDGGRPLPVSPASLSARTVHFLDLNEQAGGVVSMFLSRMKSNHQFIHYAKLHQYTNRLFNDVRLTEAVELAHGAGFLKQLKDHATDTIAGGGPKQDDPYKANALTNILAINALAYNASLFIKQMTALPTFSMYADGNFLKYSLSGARAFPGFVKALIEKRATDSNATVQAMLDVFHSDYAKGRMQGGRDYMQREVLGELEGKGKKYWESYVRKGMIFTKAGDMVPILIFGGGYYRSKIEEAAKNKMLPEEGKAWALDMLWQLVEQTQSPATPANEAWHQRRGGVAYKLLGQFGGPNPGYVGKFVHDFRMMKAAEKSGDKERISKARKQWSKTWGTLAVSNALYSAAGVLWAMILGEWPDEDDAERVLVAALTGPFGGLLIVGPLIDRAVDIGTTGSSFGSRGIVPAEAAIDPAFYGMNAIYELLQGDLGKAGKSVDRMLRGVSAPYRDVSRAVKNYSE